MNTIIRPQSKLVFSLDMQLLKTLEQSDEQDIKNLQKKIDSQPSSLQNKTMTNTTFALAVLTAIGQLRQQGAFSVHDVTKSVRNTLNQGDVNLIDRQREQFNNGDNYRVEHGEVKEILLFFWRTKSLLVWTADSMVCISNIATRLRPCPVNRHQRRLLRNCFRHP
jgi:hypothetical protein